MATCARCGTCSEDPVVLLTWSAGVERGRTTWCCDRCSREHVRSIEGKLDSQYW